MKTRLMNCVLAALAVSLSTGYGQNIPKVKFDGIFSGSDNYSDTEIVGFFNGHGKDSVYGDFENQKFETYLRYTVATVQGDNSGTEYFFLFAEVPIEVKNMIWGNQLAEADVSPYRVHYGTHHNPNDLDMDFAAATGSEKLGFVDSNGNAKLEVDLAGNGGGGNYGLIAYKDSVDYLFDKNLATEASSLNRDQTMSFELMFKVDAEDNAKIIELARNGLDYHLSPERGGTSTQVVPEPSSTLLVGLLSCLCLLIRRR